MSKILLDSLLSLYSDSPELCDLIRQLKLDELNHKFYSELYLRIDPDQFRYIDDFMRSDEVRIYKDAIMQATLSCTQQLSDMLDFVLSTNEGGKIN